MKQYSNNRSIYFTKNSSDCELVNRDTSEIEVLQSSYRQLSSSSSLININDQLLNSSVSYVQPEENFDSSSLGDSVILLNNTPEELLKIESFESNSVSTKFEIFLFLFSLNFLYFRLVTVHQFKQKKQKI